MAGDHGALTKAKCAIKALGVGDKHSQRARNISGELLVPTSFP
jgi:hypothetical protein